MTARSAVAVFKESLKENNPDTKLSDNARALWFAGKGNWNKAHEIVQDLPDSVASLIHAFLHRQEGDISNARYWYARAGSKMPDSTLDEEWETLVRIALES